MIRIILIFFLIFSNLIANAGEKELREIIKKTYPELTVMSIQKTNYNDLYEIFIGGQIIYSDENFNFLIVEGRLVDPKTKADLTSARLKELNQIDFDSLPFKNAIKEIRGDGRSRIAVFSDVDCPFCRKLEKETISKLKDVTIYTFLYPLAIHPDAKKKSKKIWCAENKLTAWNNYMINNDLPKNDGSCDTPIEENLKLARKLGISSTPTIIVSSGRRIEGALPYEDIKKYIQ